MHRLSGFFVVPRGFFSRGEGGRAPFCGCLWEKLDHPGTKGFLFGDFRCPALQLLLCTMGSVLWNQSGMRPHQTSDRNRQLEAPPGTVTKPVAGQSWQPQPRLCRDSQSREIGRQRRLGFSERLSWKRRPSQWHEWPSSRRMASHESDVEHACVGGSVAMSWVGLVQSKVCW